MEKIKYSFITTVFNEEETIQKLLKSIFSQTQKPDEVIIVDGGSTDKTVEKINFFKKEFANKNIELKVFSKKGNRSVGRNEAINRSAGNIIVCSDTGCVLDKNWVENITKPFEDKKIDVIAGYYASKASTLFQKCLVPYVLVMPDRVNPKTFLPATRSMAMRRLVWEELGGFDERFSNNEDYVFARKIKKYEFIVRFAKNAIVFWIPPDNIKKAFFMFYRFALGDSESGIIRPKVLFIYFRYFIVTDLFLLILLTKSSVLFITLLFLSIMYVVWSIGKNYKYVRKWQAVFYLPLLQFASDIAVISGTCAGFMKFTTI